MQQLRRWCPEITGKRRRRRCGRISPYDSIGRRLSQTLPVNKVIGNRTLLAPDNAASEDMRSYSYQNYTHHLAGELQGDAYTAHQYDWAGQLLGQATNVDDGNGGSTRRSPGFE